MNRWVSVFATALLLFLGACGGSKSTNNPPPVTGVTSGVAVATINYGTTTRHA
jgi:hypothetical protein